MYTMFIVVVGSEQLRDKYCLVVVMSAWYRRGNHSFVSVFGPILTGTDSACSSELLTLWQVVPLLPA